MANSNATRLWEDPATHAFVLLAMLFDQNGGEITTWDPGTIALEIRDDFGVQPPPVNLDKVLAAVTLLSGNDYYTSATDFAQITLALVGRPRDFLPDVIDCAWGMTEAMLIAPPDPDEENPFHPEIVTLLGMLLSREGILNPPDVLRIGVKDPGLAESARYGYSDDPDLFQMITDFEHTKTQEINATIHDRMVELLNQLKMAPLQNGKAEMLAARMLQSLDRTRQISSVLPSL